MTTSRPAASRGARLEHRVGLADAGRHAEKNLEPTAFLRGLLALDGTQQRIGIGAVLVSHAFRVFDATKVS
jgi:hypothetical protein